MVIDRPGEQLRREVSALRLKAEAAAPRAALIEERSGRELGEGAMRQASVKFAEALTRETVALRADNAALRASLPESLRLLAEERNERQADTAEAAKRLRDLLNSRRNRRSAPRVSPGGADAPALPMRRPLAGHDRWL